MPTRQFVVVLSLAAAVGCSGDVTGPVSALRFRVEFLGATAIVPGEPLVARVEVFNPRATPVVFEGCPPRLQLVREGDPIETEIGLRPAEYGFVGINCYGGWRSEIPPLGSLVDTLSWLGQTVPPGELGVPSSITPLPSGVAASSVPLPPGPQRIRPVLVHLREVVARGDPYDVAIRPWTRVRLVNTLATDDALELRIGGRVVTRLVARASASAPVVVPAGRHVVEVWREGDAGALATDTMQLAEGRPRLLAVRRAGAAHDVWVIPNGGVATTPLQTALRAIHLAETADAFEVRLLAPGTSVPIVMAPLSYGTISPYVVGDTGSWRVMVVGGAQDTLLATGTLRVSRGATVDVFLTDSPTGRVWATLVDR